MSVSVFFLDARDDGTFLLAPGIVPLDVVTAVLVDKRGVRFAVSIVHDVPTGAWVAGIDAVAEEALACCFLDHEAIELVSDLLTSPELS